MRLTWILVMYAIGAGIALISDGMWHHNTPVIAIVFSYVFGWVVNSKAMFDGLQNAWPEMRNEYKHRDMTNAMILSTIGSMCGPALGIVCILEERIQRYYESQKR